MTQEQIDSVKAEISAFVEVGSTVAATVAPEFLPYIILGKAVAKVIPPLFEDVVKLIQKNQPTEADALALAQNIARLSHPELL